MTAISENLPATKGEQLEANAALAEILAKLISGPATAAKQDAGNETLAQILAKMIAAPATAAGQATIVDGLVAILAKLSNDPATQTTLAAVLAKLSADPATNAKLETIRLLLAGTLTAAPSTDQDPIFDHANGDKKTVTASAVVFTPPAGCKFVRLDATVDTFVRTDDQVALDDGKAIRIAGGMPPEIVPVTPGVPVRAYAATSSTLRITPMKVR